MPCGANSQLCEQRREKIKEEQREEMIASSLTGVKCAMSAFSDNECDSILGCCLSKTLIAELM